MQILCHRTARGSWPWSELARFPRHAATGAARNPAFAATTQPRATRDGSLRALTKDQPMAGFGLTLATPLFRSHPLPALRESLHAMRVTSAGGADQVSRG